MNWFRSAPPKVKYSKEMQRTTEKASGEIVTEFVREELEIEGGTAEQQSLLIQEAKERPLLPTTTNVKAFPQRRIIS